MLILRYIIYVETYVASAEIVTMASSIDDPDGVRNDDTMMDESSTGDDLSTTAYDEYVVRSPETFKIKILFKLQSGESPINVGPNHRTILQQLLELDQQLVVEGQNKSKIDISKLSNEAFKRNFTYHPIPRRHFKLVGVTHRITTTMSMKDIKTELQKVLTKYRATIAINTWNTLDVRDIGWFCNIHPYFHQRDHLFDFLTSAIKTFTKSSDIPEFKLYVKSVVDGKPNSDTRTSARAVHVECRSDQVGVLRDLFQQTYSKGKGLPGHFVPNNLQHLDNKQLHKTYIQQQNKYIDEHRNITVSDVTLEDLQMLILYNKKKISIQSALNYSSSISWMSPSPKFPNENKWNLSTTAHHYPIAVKTIQAVIIENIKGSSSNMTKQNDTTSTSKTTTSETTQSYLEVLTSTSSHFDLPKPIPQVIEKPNLTFQEQTKQSRTYNSNISSLGKSINRNPSVEIDNMKEHITRSLAQIRKEFASFQTDIRHEVKTQINEIVQNNTNEFESLSNSISEVSKSMKDDRKQLQMSLLKDLRTIIQEEIRDSMKLIHQVSPRKRHPKRHRKDDDDSDSELSGINRNLFDTQELPEPAPDEDSVHNEHDSLMEESETSQDP